MFYDRGEKYDSRGKELIENDIENDREQIGNVFARPTRGDGNVPHSYLPGPAPTGDRILPWLLLMLASGTALAVTMTKGRKKYA